jgi:hypothetical protein
MRVVLKCWLSISTCQKLNLVKGTALTRKNKMNSNKTTARIVGTLFIIGTIAGILSVVFTSPILSDPDYLLKVSANENQLILGVIFVLTMGFALAMVPVIMFPILKKQNEALALGYVVFRGALETVTYFATAISMLLLIPLSQDYVNAAASQTSYFQTLGDLLQGVAQLPMTVFVFSLGALMFYTLLYQSKLIPRWLSVWGLIAITLHLVTGFLIVFGLQTDFSSLNTMMNFPIFLQEMVMAVWLIVKGFNLPVIAAKPQNQIN